MNNTFKELSMRFLKAYVKNYNLDLDDKKDCEEFIKAILSLEICEVEAFFQRNNIDILKYPEFRQNVINNLNDFITLERDFIDDKKIVYTTISLTSSFEKMTKQEARSFYKMIEVESIKDFSERIKKIIFNKEYDESAIEEIKESLLSKLQEARPEVTEEMEVEFGVTPKFSVSKFIKELIDRIPEGSVTSENQEEILNKMLKSLENYLINQKWSRELINQAKEILKEEFAKIYQVDNKLSYYQKVVSVFNLLNYDYLKEEEKLELLKQVKNDEFLTTEMRDKLNISDVEYEAIKKEFIVKLTELLSTSIVSKYLNLLRDVDASYYEKLQEKLTVEKIREDNEVAKELSDEEINNIIKKIKKEGLEITLEKILASDEVKKFTSNFYKKMKTATIDELESLEKELLEFQNSNLMLGLTDFNKMLLLAKLNSELQEKQKQMKVAETTKNEINEWANKISKMSSKDLEEFYEKIDSKKLVDEKAYSEEERNYIYSELEKLAIEEMANRIATELNLSEIKVENLVSLSEEIKNWKQDEFKKHHIPQKAEEKVRAELQKRIEQEKEKKQLQDVTDDYLSIGSRVVLTKDVNIYEDENAFANDQQVEKKKAKKNKLGYIGGYVVQKENTTKLLANKEDLKKYLQDGFKVIGYQFNYRKFLIPTSTYVKLDEVSSKELTTKEILKTQWKKIAAMAVGVALTIGAIMGGFKLFGGKENNQNNIKIESVKPVNNNNNNNIASKSVADKDNSTIFVNGEQKEIDQEVVEELNRIPGLNSNVSIDSDADIHTMNNLSNGNGGQKSYFNSRGITDLDRKADGYVLADEFGNTIIEKDLAKVYELIANHNYRYIATRFLNKYSKNNQDYEGFFRQENISFEGESVLDELQEKGQSRRLSK